TIDATADRELVADDDTVMVTVTVANHGPRRLVIGDLSVSGAAQREMNPVAVPPDSSVRLDVAVSGLGSVRPWWVATRKRDAFPQALSAIDGVERPASSPALVTVPGVAVPEDIRRPSDVSLTMTVAGVAVSTSIGPIVHRSASATFGVQARP